MRDGAWRCGSGGVLVLCLAAIAILPGCYGFWGPLYIFNDSWNGFEEDLSGFPAPESQLQHWEVIETKQGEAQAMLAEGRHVQLTEDQARELAGPELPADEGTSPYLLRGVYLWNPSGGFRVYLAEDGRVLVRHTAMGGATAWRVKRYALIVRLRAAPKKVICSCGAVV